MLVSSHLSMEMWISTRVVDGKSWCSSFFMLLLRPWLRGGPVPPKSKGVGVRAWTVQR